MAELSTSTGGLELIGIDHGGYYDYYADPNVQPPLEVQAARLIEYFNSNLPWNLVRTWMHCRTLEHSVKTVYGPNYVDGRTAGPPLDGIPLARAILAGNPVHDLAVEDRTIQLTEEQR